MSSPTRWSREHFLHDQPGRVVVVPARTAAWLDARGLSVVCRLALLRSGLALHTWSIASEPTWIVELHKGPRPWKKCGSPA